VNRALPAGVRLISEKNLIIPAIQETIEKVRFSGHGAKMRIPHIVPLSRQAIAILKQIQKI